MKKTTFCRKNFYCFLSFLLLLLSDLAWSQCPIVTNNLQTFCDLQSPLVSNLSAQNTGAGVAWFATPTSTVPLATGIGLVDNMIYYADNAAGNCGSRTAVTVKIYSAPIGQNFQGVCVDFAENATISDLIATGNNVRWYMSDFGGSPLSASTILVDNTIYYASQTNPYTGCETSRLSVFVNVGLVPVPTGAAIQEFCAQNGTIPTIADLQVSGNNNWYLTLSSAVALPADTPLVNGTTYYATTVDPPCESINRFAVTVIFAEANNSGQSNSIAFCASAITAGMTINLFESLGGNPSQNGIWSGPENTTISASGVVDISTLSAASSPYVFTYTVDETICSPSVSTVVVTIIEEPIATISGNQDICFGQSATVLFTGTPGATVFYTQNGIANSIVLDQNGTASISQAFAESTTIVLNSVTISAEAVCSKTLDEQIVINVLPLPTVTISVDATTICQNQAATVTFTGTPNSTVSYLINGVAATIILNSNGTAQLTANYLVTTTITLVQIASNTALLCESPLNQQIIISVLPLPTASISISATAICNNSAATITFNGTPNTTVSYTLNGGGILTILLDASGNATITGNYTQNTVINLVSVYYTNGIGCSQNLSQSVTISVLPLPTAIISISAPQVCQGNSSTVVITGTANAIVSYTINGGAVQTIVLNNLGQATITTTLNQTTVYTLISVLNPITSCIQALNQTATVTIVPPANAGIDAVSTSVCSNLESVNLFTLLGPTAQTGGTWSPALASGTGVFNPAIDLPGTYTYTVVGNIPCPDDIATVTVSITPNPIAGTSTTVTLCTNQDPINLFSLLGSSAQTGGVWSPTLSSGSGIFDPLVDLAGIYTYTVAGDDSCADATAQVQVILIIGVNAGTDASVSLCTNSGIINLLTYLGPNAQTGGTWTPMLASGSNLFNPLVDAAGTYTYSFESAQECGSDSASVTITVNPAPDAGNDGEAFFCTNYSPADLFTYLDGSPQAGGIWSPALASGTGIFDPMVDLAGTYTYTVGSELCGDDTATIVVTVQLAPNAGGYGMPLVLSACFTTTSVDLFTALNGNQATDGFWLDDDNTGAILDNIFNPSIVGPGIYHFTYLVTGGSSPCDSDAATVTVVVDPIPNAGSFVPQALLCNTGMYDLFNLLSGAQLNGIWTNQNSQVLPSILDLSTLTAGTHILTYTVTNSCGTDSENVTITLLQAPVVNSTDITLSSPICAGSNMVVNFSNIANGQYTVIYNLGGANIINNQIGTLTVVNGSGSFTVNAGQIPNAGVTTIEIVSLTNIINQCTTLISNITLSFLVNPYVNVTNNNISVNNTCFGGAVTVLISNATSLANGVYDFTYLLQNGTPSTGVSGPVTIVNGSGQFTIPASYFPAIGTYQITINGVSSQTTGCQNVNSTAVATFQISNGLDTSGANISIGSACIGSPTVVTISNALLLENGSYTVTYSLTGSNVYSGTSLVTILDGVGTFTIPSSAITNSGTITFTLLGIVSNVTNCGTSGANFNVVTFVVNPSPTVVLLEEGNLFCFTDNPTIADLTANIEGSLPVQWFAEANGGDPLLETLLLVDGQTYYAVVTSANGCKNSIRFAVTVDLDNCPKITIPDGFSPNNDGINDSFEIENLRDLFPNFKIEIFNRYGNILFKGSKEVADWDGTASGASTTFSNNVVPTGVYFYILDFNDGITKPIQGRLYLNR